MCTFCNTREGVECGLGFSAHIAPPYMARDCAPGARFAQQIGEMWVFGEGEGLIFLFLLAKGLRGGLTRQATNSISN